MRFNVDKYVYNDVVVLWANRMLRNLFQIIKGVAFVGNKNQIKKKKIVFKKKNRSIFTIFFYIIVNITQLRVPN